MQRFPQVRKFLVPASSAVMKKTWPKPNESSRKPGRVPWNGCYVAESCSTSTSALPTAGKISLTNSSREWVDSFGKIVFEKLAEKNMLRNHYLAKSISDAAWNQLIAYTTYKAENAGRVVVTVDPRNTSRQCSCCGTMVEKSLSVRVHTCPICGLSMDRDQNAAINILGLGLQSLGIAHEAPAL